MDGKICRIMETNPKISMEIRTLLEDSGLSARQRGEGELFASISSDGTLLGVIGGRQFESDCLIKYIAVREDHCRKGIGSGLTGKFLSYFSGRCERAFLLSTREAVPFFVQFGFESVPSDRLPGLIRESSELHEVTVSATTILMLELPKKWPII